MKAPHSSHRRGNAIAVAVLFTIVVGAFVGIIMQFAITEQRLNLSQRLWTQARYGAESAVEYASAQICKSLTTYGSPLKNAFQNGQTLSPALIPAVGLPDSVDRGSVKVYVGELSPRKVEKVAASADDELAESYVVTRYIDVFAEATASNAKAGKNVTAYCSHRIWVRYDSPGRGFAFYIPDLEIAPGPNMYIAGPMFSNRDYYYQANNSLTNYGSVATAGRLYHGRKDGSGQSESGGNVYFATGERDPSTNELKKDGSGNNYVTLAKDSKGRWIESTMTDYRKISDSLFRGMLKTAEQGVKPRKLIGLDDYVPEQGSTPAQNGPHDLIEPAIPNSSGTSFNLERENRKFVSTASLIIEIKPNGTNPPIVTWYKTVESAGGAYSRIDANGNEVKYNRVALTSPPAGVVTTGASLPDRRRSTTNIKAYDVDIAKLKKAIEGTDASIKFNTGEFNPASDWNGSLYIDCGTNPSGSGVRLKNGSSLPNRGLQEWPPVTIATNNALYIQGNFNADGKNMESAGIASPDSSTEALCTLAADAITVLSNNWKDTDTTHRATPTEVSAVFVTGIVPTNKGGTTGYSGGVENYPRFLEDWSGITFGYRGSFVALFESEVATQKWTGSVYSPPTRWWGWDTRFAAGATLPRPLSDGFPTFRRIFFRELSADQFTTAVSSL